MSNEIDTIRRYLGEEELLTQLAEEATELAHAALKLRRAMKGDNPTTVSAEDAYNNLLEEVSDIEVCLAVLNYAGEADLESIRRICAEKTNRWAKRLEERNNGEVLYGA